MYVYIYIYIYISKWFCCPPDLLDELGSKLCALNRPFVVGGDFNMSAEELDDMGWVQRIGGVVVAPSARFPTSCTSGKGRTVDFFVVSKGLEYLVADCYVVEGALTTPHRPVRIEFYAKAKVPKIRVARAPRAFPDEAPVFGPRRPPTHWDSVHALAADRSCSAIERLQPLALAWMEAYETTMCGLYDVSAGSEAVYRGRGQEPRFAWVHPRSSRGSTHAKTCEQARQWHWLGDRVAEFAKLQHAECVGARQHRKQLLVKLRKWKPPPDHTLSVESKCAPHIRGALPEDAEAVSQGFRRWAKKTTCASMAGHDWWASECQRLAERYESRFATQRQKQWRQWSQDACEKGGKAAHRWTKPAVGTTIGTEACTPQGKVEETLEEWLDIWDCEDAARDWTDMPVGEPLPRPAAGAIRKAARSIKACTALSGDFLHPRSVELLEDEALDDLAELFLVMEEVGRPPLELLTLVFIPKPDGGKRPIGLLTGVMRLWGKTRRPFGKQWEEQNARPYFWAGHGRPASDSAHQQALRAEVARARGQESASA